MNQLKQIRLAISEIDRSLLDAQIPSHTPAQTIWFVRCARYQLNLLEQLVVSISEGQPQPWSNFKPMVVEEFSK
jgi:hypothetical protein